MTDSPPRRTYNGLYESDRHASDVVAGLQGPNFGTYQTDRNGFIYYIDFVYARLLGRPMDQILGRHFLEFTSGEGWEESRTRFSRVMAQGGFVSFRKHYVRADGGRAYALVSLNALHDQLGAISGALGIFQLLTEGAELISGQEGGEYFKKLERPLSSDQSRAARGWLGWSVRDLALASQVSSATINRFEADLAGTAVRRSSLGAIRNTFESRGISFFEDFAGNRAVSKTS